MVNLIMKRHHTSYFIMQLMDQRTFGAFYVETSTQRDVTQKISGNFLHATDCIVPSSNVGRGSQLSCVNVSMVECGTLNGLSDGDFLVAGRVLTGDENVKCGTTDIVLHLPLYVSLPYASHPQLSQLLSAHDIAPQPKRLLAMQEVLTNHSKICKCPRWLCRRPIANTLGPLHVQ